jgi:hypothetical protein
MSLFLWNSDMLQINVSRILVGEPASTSLGHAFASELTLTLASRFVPEGTARGGPGQAPIVSGGRVDT